MQESIKPNLFHSSAARLKSGPGTKHRSAELRDRGLFSLVLTRTLWPRLSWTQRPDLKVRGYTTDQHNTQNLTAREPDAGNPTMLLMIFSEVSKVTKDWRRGSESNRRIKVLQTLKKLLLTLLLAT